MPARRLNATTSWSAQDQPAAILMTVRRPRLASLAFSGHLILWYFRLLFGW
jgi:hypothetical protein